MTRRPWLLLILAALTTAPALRAADEPPIRNWKVPQRSSSAPHVLGEISQVAIFIAVAPCRIVDTRGAVGAFGGPKLTAGASRSFNLPAGPCSGIPVAAAYSLNITVTQTSGDGFLAAYPTGPVPSPLVSTINFTGVNETLANAAVVPATSGSIDVLAGVNGTHLVIDINGFYMDAFGTLAAGDRLSLTGDVSGGGVIQATNTNTSTFTFTSAIRGIMSATQDGVQAIRADQTGTSGVNQAILASNASATQNARGVNVKLGAPPFSGPSTYSYGVESDSNGFNGVGLYGAGTYAGARGDFIFSGSISSTGWVGYSTQNGFYTPQGLSVVGTKNFVEPHPTDPTKVIRYVSLEGPEAGTYFRGRGRFRDHGALIEVPEDFRLVSSAEGLSVQVTPIGDFASVAVTRLGLDAVELKATRDVEFFYTVNGVRRAYPDWKPIQEQTREDSYFVPAGPDAKLDRLTSEELRQRLVANGTYCADGTVNRETAERVGWAQVWREREERARAFQREHPSLDGEPDGAVTAPSLGR